MIPDPHTRDNVHMKGSILITLVLEGNGMCNSRHGSYHARDLHHVMPHSRSRAPVTKLFFFPCFSSLSVYMYMYVSLCLA